MGKTKILNLEKAKIMLDKVQEKCTVRCISISHIENALGAVDDRLKNISTKKDAIGTNVNVDWNAQIFPRAYNYTPYSTVFSATLTSKGWRIDSVEREKTRPHHRIIIHFTEETLKHLAEHFDTIY